jgi:hypothetical protein
MEKWYKLITKVKVTFLSLTKHYAMKTYRGSGGKWSASHPGGFTPWERTPGTRWIGGRVDPKASESEYSLHNKIYLSNRVLLGYPMEKTHSSVVHLWTTSWMIRSSIPGRGWEFFSSLPPPDRLWGPHSGTGALSLGVKRPMREADHSPPSSAEVKE